MPIYKDLLTQFAESGPGRHLHDAVRTTLRDQEIAVTGIAGSLDAFLIASLFGAGHRQFLVLVPDRDTGERLRDDLAGMLGSDTVVAFGSREQRGQAVDAGGDIRALRALIAGENIIVVATVTGLLQALPDVQAVSGKTFRVQKGEARPFAGVREALDDLGFIQKDFVEVAGDYAVRGGILDIFPHSSDNPVRLEFFGDSIESIREFDQLSQRSIRELESALIVPDLLAMGSPGGAPPSANLTGYLRNDALLVLMEPAALRGALDDAANTRAGGPGDTLESLTGGFHRVLLVTVQPPAGAIDFGAKTQPAFNGSIPVLRSALAGYLAEGYNVSLLCDGQAEMARLKDLLATETRPYEREAIEAADDVAVELDLAALSFHPVSLHLGFLFPAIRQAVLTEHQIFNRAKRRGRRRVAKFRGLSEKEFHLLRRGEFVVHEDYGIGRFDGLKKIRVQSSEQEVVSLLYEGNDRLYVNLNYINKLQKYSSSEGHTPALTRLGSSEWDRLKSRAKKKVKDIARELITLYARRRSLPGHSFQPDAPWQKELEATFIYEDTFDQAKATREVKDDMEAQWPMDRLICGDVGFGKTEVAVRAAFKAVLDGKQVAVLVPTTILAMQHLHTFTDRTSKYGLRVEELSRFKTKAEQSGILRQLAAGGIDIVIGTHRLLSKDVAFKDLGLLIIDEEHRFGVSAKEKLRQIRVTVDTLSLTATPIPRTLHFSLLGARDLSLIGTPPRNRLPVLTEILEWSDEVIHNAVIREVQRGGQVFFVHDRIQNIDEITARLARILPGIRIRVAHGQMHAHQLEEVMMEFLERRSDLLVATKIIESGLDMPNVNTMIINRADRFGMAELYQLRGRVGRSNIQAFAYLLTPPLSTVPQATLRRLQAVEEFTELGSGFNLAMRDLEIRGAGNLLGSEQSGFIENMGFEIYTRVLEEAVRELKEDDFRELFQKDLEARPRPVETIVEPDFDALIPEEYIRNDTERLAIYRRLYRLTTDEQLSEVAAELKDRFGPLPSEVENLIGAIRLRLFASRYRFRKVRLSTESMEVEFPPENDTVFYDGDQFQRLMGRISAQRARGTRLRQDENALVLVVKFPDSSTPSHSISLALQTLEQLVSGDET